MISSSGGHPAAIRREPSSADAASTILHEVCASWTSLSVLLCASFLLAACVGRQHFGPHGGVGDKVRMALLVAIWYWTTTTWAAEVKQILAVFTIDGTQPASPLFGFWLTFAPQLLSSVFCLFGLCWRSGASITKDMVTFRSRGYRFWLVAGAAYWFGQFFTVQSLIFGTPAVTFVVKAAEPLSTALLAVLVLRKAFSLPLLLGIFVACVGIIVTVRSANGAHGHSSGSQQQLTGMAFALLGNLGFSSRACVAKKAISQLHVDPFETYGMMTIAGAQAGILPILAYAVTSHTMLGSSGTIWALPCIDPRFSASSWFMMCLSYMLYQTCSVLILSSIAVESHALLVAMKHMLVVVLVSFMIHTEFSRGILFGMLLTVFGVYLYNDSTKDIRAMGKDNGIKETEVLVVKDEPLPKAASAWQVPTALNCIVLAITMIGCATPSAIAVLGLHSGPDAVR